MITVAFVVNGDSSSAMGHRAKAFAERLQGQVEVRIYYRSSYKVLSLLGNAAQLCHFRPQVCYVLDMGYSGIAAGVLYRFLSRGKLVVDTGDAITELARSMGRNRIGITLTRCLETLAYWAADRIVVRGSFHQEWLARRGVSAEVIPDGVETDLFAPTPDDGLRKQLGLEGVFTVGLVGSSIWSETLQTCYGWDLVEAVRLLRDRRVQGVFIGDGSGVAVLRERCRRYGLEDRVQFLGRLPYEELPRYLGVIDVCLSTQTDDLVGRVRTTGKLPLYLAAGRYVLASRVGEAARVLPDEMLVNYEGQIDPNYPGRLAERVRRLLDEPDRLCAGLANTALARAHFDYDVLAKKANAVLEVVSGITAKQPGEPGSFPGSRSTARPALPGGR